MIIESLILIGVYVGKRIYENRRGDESPPAAEVEIKAPQEPQPEALAEQTREDDHYLKTTTLSMGLAAFRQVNPSLSLVSTLAIVYNSFPILRGAERSLLQERKVGNDVLVSCAIVMGLGMDFFLPLSVGAWVYYLGRKFINKAQQRSQQALAQIYETQPYPVWVVRDGAQVEVPLNTLAAHDIVFVKSGMTIPVDGVIAEGMAMIDQYFLTGESQLVEKGVGDQVCASTMVVSGQLHIEVQKTGQQTTAAQIISIFNSHRSYLSTVQLKGEEWADAAALPLLIGGGLVFPLWGASSTLIILNSSIGNPVRVHAPLGTLNHVTLASRQHILIKTGQVLESLSQVDTVIFDKTGTLTQKEPKVSRIIGLDGFAEDDILRFAATAEGKLSHPIATALLKKAAACALELPVIEASEYQIGYGIIIRAEGWVIRVGSLRFLKKEAIAVPAEVERIVAEAQAVGFSHILVSVDDRLVGSIELQPVVRPEVDAMMAGLRRRGIKNIYLVSGDHEQTTGRLAHSLGMDGYFHDTLPEAKADIVAHFQQEGRKVCFVGDGINDIIAMQQADISISLHDASTVAHDVASIVLMDGNLDRINDLFDISANLQKNMHNSLRITLIPMAINITGALTLGLGVVSAYMIKMSFFAVGLGNAMLPLKTGIKSASVVARETAEPLPLKAEKELLST